MVLKVLSSSLVLYSYDFQTEVSNDRDSFVVLNLPLWNPYVELEA